MLDEFTSIDLVLNFFSKPEVLIQKMSGRRMCPCCNKNFNVASVHTDCGYHMEPLLPNGPDPTVCDGDHETPVKLVMRDDDVPEVIQSRLDLYNEQTLPILDHYKQKEDTLVLNFEAKNGKKDYPELKNMLVETIGEEFLHVLAAEV